MPADPARKASQVLAEIDSGNFDAAVSMDLQTLVELVQQRGAPGVMTLKFKVTPRGLNNHAVEVTVEHEVKRPKPAAAGSMYFVGDHGSIHRSDPYQQTIPTTKDHTA